MNALAPLAFVNSTFGWLVVMFLALLLFGSRLPGVARNLGKGINEFKKGLNDPNSGSGDGDGDDPEASRPLPRKSAPPRETAKTHIDDTSV